MNSGRMAVLGLAAALGIGTTAAVLDYRSDARSGELVELSADDLEARTRHDGEAEADVVVEDDDVGAGGDDSDPKTTTRGGKGTGGKTTGGQRGDTTQNGSNPNTTTRGGSASGGGTS
jgi:hypothetical protein